MSSETHSIPAPAATPLPEVPLTLDGASVLHQMMRVRWPAWNALPEAERSALLAEAAQTLGPMETAKEYQSACYSVLGHKADLLFVHMRPDFAGLKAAELQLQKLRLAEYLEPVHSYLSVVELGLYESTPRLYASLAEKGVEPHSPEWTQAIEEKIEQQKKAMYPRLYPQIPQRPYICFYPMDRKRGEEKNWYQVPMAERQRMMHEHGMVGRRYAGTVQQIITGSIGFDDWEWGVDLFADDPLVFKKLIYEMRFDEVSAVYALFGSFYVGLRVPAAGLADLFEGKITTTMENHGR